MNTATITNGVHRAREKSASDTTDDTGTESETVAATATETEKKKKVRRDAPTLVSDAVDDLRKIQEDVLAWTSKDEDANAGLSTIRDAFVLALDTLGSVPNMMRDIAGAIEKGTRSNSRTIALGAMVTIKPEHRATIAGALPEVSKDVLAGEHKVRNVTPTHVTLRIGDATVPLRCSQVEPVRVVTVAFTSGEFVKIKAGKVAKYAADHGIDDLSALSDLTVASCHGDTCMLRATVNGESVLIRAKASHVEK